MTTTNVVPRRALHFLQLELRLLAQFAVERRQRLVEQQQLRAFGERTRQRHALFLSARELVWPALAEPLKLHQPQHLGDAFGDFRTRHAFLLQAEGDVLLDAHMREQGVGLEHHVDRPLVRRHVGHVVAADKDAARVRLLEPGNAGA